MLRRYQTLLGAIYALFDAFSVAFALLFAWLIRFRVPFLPQFHHLSFLTYMSVMPVAVLAFLFASAVVGLYGTTRQSRLRTIGIAQGKSVVAMALIVILVLYVEKELNYSKSVILLSVVLTWGFAFLVRFVARWLLRVARRQGFNRKYVLLVGMTETTALFMQQLAQQTALGYQVIGYLDFAPSPQPYAQPLAYLGKNEDLDWVLGAHIVDHLVMTMASDDHGTLHEVMTVAEAHGIHALLVPSFLSILPSRPRFDEFAGIPIIDTRYTPLDDIANVVAKRAFDLVFSSLVLLLLSPLLLVIALLIAMTSKGPIIYKQERIGRNRRVFPMYKFRTMLCDDDATEPGWTVKDDPRRTKIGAFLRKTSLDELPQFVNVLLGDMSVIGPRPEQPYFVEQFRDDIPRYMIKHRVRPGITGWAQVNGLRGDTSIEERIRYDLHYIEHWSFSWDLRIVILTVWKGFRNHNAY
nr:undecaprenyl-phosphate glucose phosphotransferase [Bacilli bacterium]